MARQNTPSPPQRCPKISLASPRIPSDTVHTPAKPTETIQRLPAPARRDTIPRIHPVRVQGLIGASHASADSNWSITSRSAAPSEWSSRMAVSVCQFGWTRSPSAFNVPMPGQAADIPRPRIGSPVPPRPWDFSPRGMSLRISRGPFALLPVLPPRSDLALACRY